MQDPWKTFHAASNGPDRLEYSAQIKLLPEFKILDSLVQPDVSATVIEDVLRELKEFTLSIISSDQCKTKYLETHVYYTMEAILEIAAKTPLSQHSQLVDFVVQLQKQIITDPKTGQPLTINLYGNDVIWSELPYLTLNIIENENHCKNRPLCVLLLLMRYRLGQESLSAVRKTAEMGELQRIRCAGHCCLGPVSIELQDGLQSSRLLLYCSAETQRSFSA